jgi:Flp pilus assembly protein TadG
MNIRRFTHAQRFLQDTRGSLLPMFALSLLPVMALTGVAVDFSRAATANTKMQAALDATVLAMSANASSLTPSQLSSQAQSYFSAVFTGTGAVNPTFTITYSNTNGPQLTATASATMNTLFLGLAPVKMSSLNISGSSTTAWGNSRLRVALVLDNTGSMAQSGKISALKTATNNLLTQLKAAAVNNGDVYVSIIPFVKDINVDPVNYNASWIDWTDWDANNGKCTGGGVGFGGAWGQTQSSCNGTWTPDNHNTWNGCIADRGNSNGPNAANYDTNVVAPTTSITASLFPAEQYGSCPQAIMGLSYNWSAMTTEVNNMSPNGNTNQAIGLALGWMSLVGGGPFTVPAMSPNYTYQQIMILVTDGLNTEDRWYLNQSSIDARQTLTCSNIKASGITLYTIQVSTDGTPLSPLLQQCASDSSKFFMLTSSAEIVTTFNSIATKLSQLRIAK